MLRSLTARPFPPLTLAMLSLLQFMAAGYTRLTGHGEEIANTALRGGVRPPEIPAGYAFSIWGVIFVLSAVFGAYYATRGQNDPLMQKLSWPAAVLFIFSSAWMVAAQAIGDGWHLVFLIVMMWAAAVHGLMVVRFDASPVTRWRTWVMQPMFGLFTGWLTAAMLLNITGTFAKTVGTFGLAPNHYALITLVGAGVLSVALIHRLKGEPWLFAAAIWAVVGVGVANNGNPPNMPIIWACAALGSVLVAFFIWTRLKRPL